MGKQYKGEDLDNITSDIRNCSALINVVGCVMDNYEETDHPTTDIIADSLYYIASTLEQISLKMEQL